MAGVGMGNMLINVMGMAVIFGFNGAIETLVSQAYGFGKFKLCGVFLNRGKSVVTAILIPIIVLFVYSDKILIAIGQNPDISIISKHYVVTLIPGCWAMAQFDALKKFLSAQTKN
jgi:MATE family multidrug resistance protein